MSNQQLAIASKYPAWTSWYQQWQPSPDDPPRGFAFAALNTPKGVLLVYTVHLKANGGEVSRNIAKREESARQLAAHVQKMRKTYPGAKTIIGGDFNSLETAEYEN